MLFAIISLTVRETTPFLNQYRGNFERYISNMLQVPVTIQQVSVSWRQYQPVIDLERVTFYNKDTQEPVITVERVTLFFSIPSSIWSKQIVTSGIVLDGARLSISQSAEGEYTVRELQSLGIESTATHEAAFNDVMTWVSQIPKLTLRHIDVEVTRFQKPKHDFTLRDLYFVNTATTHRVEGEAILHQNLPTELSVTVEWQGQNFDIHHLNSNIYLYVSGLNLPLWLRDQSWQGWMVKEGIASARVWLSSSEGKIKQVQSQLQLYGLKIKSTETNEECHLNRISGNIGWKDEGEQLIIAGDDVLLNFPEHLWPVTNFYVSLTKSKDQSYRPTQLKLSYFDLQDLQFFAAPLAKLIPEKTKSWLNLLSTKGGIQNLAIDFPDDWKDWQHVHLKGQMQHVSINPWLKYPGATNLSGDLEWLGSSGRLRLNSAKTTFNAPKIFHNDLYLDQITGLIEIKKNVQDQWKIQLSNIQLLNRDFAMTAQGSFILLPKGLPIADISANFTVQQATHVSDYLPLAIFEKNLNQWLKQAFLAGELQDGRAVLRGPLANFPFDKQKGEFSVTGRLSHVDLSFAPNWPTLNKIDGKIAFVGRKLEIDIAYAETLGLETSGVHGVIPNIGGKDPSILEVTTQPFEMDAKNGLNYIYNSPLQRSIGKMLKELKLQGPSHLSLSLKIPLEHPENTVVRGDLSFKNSILTIAPYDLAFTHVSGDLFFTENSVEANKIRSTLFNRPFQFNLSTNKNVIDHAVVQAAFENTFDTRDIEKWLKYPFSNYVNGDTKVSGVIDLEQDQPIKISLKSNLNGLKITANTLIDKTAEEEKEFVAELIVAENEPLKARVQYDNEFNIAMLLTREKNNFKVTSADLGIGEGVPAWPTQPGLFISGHLKTLDTDKIKLYLQQATSSKKSALSLQGVNLIIDLLHYGNLELTDLQLKATPANNNWLVSINSKEMAGKITAPKQLSRRGLINAQLSKVYLNTSEKKSTSNTDLNILNFPAISLSVEDFKVNNMSLGALHFNATPKQNGLTISKLNLDAPYLSLQSSGEWLQSEHQIKTNISGIANTSNVTRMLSMLAFTAHNFEADKGSAQFNLRWDGSPFDVSLANLQGKGSFSIGGGRIVDVGKEGGAKMDLARMLSLFSLQTIPRRLLFDFSDVFHKGYSFDYLRGDFIFNQGNLYTNKMLFDGPVARLIIKGRIGLTDKDYDLALNVSSHVTSSIPVAATLLTGNPLIGIGAFVANAVVGSSLSKAVGYDYTIKGTWDKPSWKAVKTK